VGYRRRLAAAGAIDRAGNRIMSLFDPTPRRGHGAEGGGGIRQLRWLLVALTAIGCGLPKNVNPPSVALLDTRETTLGELVTAAVAKHPGESGFLLFNTGEGAIQARVAMADVAQSSIDAQYFQWGRDTVGRVLIDRLIAAADRGVRVRLLIDDYWASGHDPAFQAIDAHPNIEIRVFNPFSRGRMRVSQLLGRFTELNRRMHNKLFVADGQVAVVGGRNLHDEYFGLGKEICYRDFDLLAIGPVAAEAEAGFDRY
jgi:putative cardiolipin synthase